MLIFTQSSNVLANDSCISIPAIPIIISSWKIAIRHEYVTLLNNNIWSLVKLSPNKTLIGSKWVLKLK
ncbi:hypothetical protein CR513_59895, partial [Mucuna pruriens]